ncbi:phosphopentomutase [Neobacillus terrae]|uniref:phosphopentomutase n=1 Tax=Neobacillus terrae TaxID=3034837 RepID=UPI00140D0323|nr:phosphopentomutase [Neobacillus terrae]NHM31429.1 phosphopentomutase [Neobacillus terrae]
MGRFVVVVLDSFGVGAMDDVPEVRPRDIGANTCRHIIEAKPDLELPTLEKLGLINALGKEIGKFKFSETAVYGISDLMHEGGDTFLGHQEIMGTIPKRPLIQPFNDVIDEVYAALVEKGYDVQFIGNNAKLLLVNDCVTVGDNLETDPGRVYNVTGCLDLIDFNSIKAIGRVVRSVVKISRVIAFGGEDVTKEDLIAAIRENEGKYIGVDAPKSGVYKKGYQVIHLGYGIDPQVQVPTILGKMGIPVALIGKVADIVENDYGTSIAGVESAWLFEQTIEQIQKMENGYVCLNIQETDLAGHAEDVERYADRLKVSDAYLAKLIEKLSEEDILVIMADHGNDPTIGHSNHTRERVPLLIYKKGESTKYIGHRKTMSDVGATAVDYFAAPKTENGSSFLQLLNLEK